MEAENKKKELEKQGKQFALQQHSIKLQNFENSFK